MPRATSGVPGITTASGSMILRMSFAKESGVGMAKIKIKIATALSSTAGIFPDPYRGSVMWGRRALLIKAVACCHSCVRMLKHVFVALATMRSARLVT